MKIIEKKSNILYNIEHKNRDHGSHGTGQGVVQMKALLTIDDVPEKVHREVTDYLLEKGIPAVFFAIEQSAETNRESIMSAFQHGFHVQRLTQNSKSFVGFYVKFYNRINFCINDHVLFLLFLRKVFA